MLPIINIHKTYERANYEYYTFKFVVKVKGADIWNMLETNLKSIKFFAIFKNNFKKEILNCN